MGAHTLLIPQLNSKLWIRELITCRKTLFFKKKLIENTRYLFDDNFNFYYRMGGNEPELEDGIENAKELESYG